jgi:hypothetical protein
MEILKTGHIPAERSYKMECRTCNTVFRFLQKEGKIIYDQREGDFIQISCPLCHNKITCALSGYER